MCGRYTLASHDVKLPSLWTSQAEREQQEASTPPMAAETIITGNDLRPMRPISVYRSSKGRIEPVAVHWGLIPSWAKDVSIAKHTIHARSETLAKKPAFRGSFRYKRAVVPASGFYEWQHTPEGKRTNERYYFTLASGEPFFMAALWDSWRSPDGTLIDSASLITTAANDLVAPMHDRMPAILTPKEAELWMLSDYDPDLLNALLRPVPANALVCRYAAEANTSKRTASHPPQAVLVLDI